MTFIEFRDLVNKNIDKMFQENNVLYKADTNKENLWDIYLNSFPEGTNPIYITNTVHDCTCCRHFIRDIGNIVSINNGIVKTIWDLEITCNTYSHVAKAMAEYIKSVPIKNVFIPTIENNGKDRDFKLIGEDVKTFDHFYYDIEPNRVWDTTRANEKKSEYKADFDVFKSSLELITLESVKTVLELNSIGNIYKGSEWKNILEKFATIKTEYEEKKSDLYIWELLKLQTSSLFRLKNTSMGTLLLDLSKGEELEIAIKKYEAIVAPANYKRPKGLFTSAQLQRAKEDIEQLGYDSLLKRRHATERDIEVKDILFVDRTLTTLKNDDIFTKLQDSIPAKPRNLDKVEKVPIEKFINEVLPLSKSIKILFENKHKPNLFSLIAPETDTVKKCFQWGNNLSWTYRGNIADSMMKQRVKAAGGSITGDLRFSIQWNEDNNNHDDLDAHCIEPSGVEIYYGTKRSYGTGGNLDVDIIDPKNNIAVENITYSNRNRMEDGDYLFFVQDYSHRGGMSGFRAEIEFDGEIYEFSFNGKIKTGENIKVATVTKKGNTFTIKTHMDSTSSSSEIWGCNTNTFVPVSMIMNSPNYWNGQTVGNKHYFFILDKCKTEESPSGFFNEFLNRDLHKHKQVLEAITASLRVPQSDNQLSGLGFSSTIRNSFILECIGTTKKRIEVVV